MNHYIYNNIAQKLNFWEEIATLLDGKIQFRQTLSKDLDTLIMTLPYRNAQLIITESDSKPLKFFAEIELSEIVEFMISWEGPIDKFLKLFGKHDIALGDKKFDAKYLVEAENEAVFLRISEAVAFKQQMEKHQIYSLHCKYNASSKKHEISSVINRTTDSKEALTELIQFHFLLVDKLIE